MKKAFIIILFFIALSSITFGSNNEIDLYEGDQVYLYEIYPNIQTNYIYTSNGAATFDKSSGLIEGKKSGIMYISTNENKLVKVTVKTNIKSLNINDSYQNVYVGDRYKLNYYANTLNKRSPIIIFSSDNPSVATIDESGEVYIKSSGRAIISISSSDGSISDSVILSATNFSSQIELDKFKDTIYEGEKIEVIASVIGSNHTNNGIILSTNDSDIIKVSEDGTILGLKAGDALVRIETQDKKNSILRKIKVVGRLEKVNIIQNEIVIDGTQSIKVPYEVNYVSGAPKNGLQLIWTTINPEIASVDQNGLITAKVDGETLLILKYDDTKILDTARVVVKNINAKQKKYISELSFGDIKNEAYVGEIVDIPYDYSPKDGNVDIVSFTSLKTENTIMSVDEKRYIIANKENTDLITASYGTTIFDKHRIKFKPIIKSIKLVKSTIPKQGNKYLFYVGEKYQIEADIDLINTVSDDKILSEIEEVTAYPKGKPLFEAKGEEVTFIDMGIGMMQVVSSDITKYELIPIVVESAFFDIKTNLKSEYKEGEVVSPEISGIYKSNLLKSKDLIDFRGDIKILNEYISKEYVQEEIKYEQNLVNLLSDNTKFDIQKVYDELKLHRDRLSKLNYITNNSNGQYYRVPESLHLTDRDGNIIDVASYENGVLKLLSKGMIELKISEKGSLLSKTINITIK